MDQSNSSLPRPPDMLVRQRRRRERLSWEAQWSRPEYAPPWLRRGVSKEIVEAVEQGWFTSGGSALDIGCGEGEVAGWMAAQGYNTVGFDIAPAAIARAQAMHAAAPGKLEFLAIDICATPPPDLQYTAIIDRGCLHQIAPEDWAVYRENLLQVAAPAARMLLFMKAFRDGIPMGDAAEEERVVHSVEQALGSHFEKVRHALTYLDPYDGARADCCLPGMVFWLTRRGT